MGYYIENRKEHLINKIEVLNDDKIIKMLLSMLNGYQSAKEKIQL